MEIDIIKSKVKEVKDTYEVYLQLRFAIDEEEIQDCLNNKILFNFKIRHLRGLFYIMNLETSEHYAIGLLKCLDIIEDKGKLTKDDFMKLIHDKYVK